MSLCGLFHFSKFSRQQILLKQLNFCHVNDRSVDAITFWYWILINATRCMSYVIPSYQTACATYSESGEVKFSIVRCALNVIMCAPNCFFLESRCIFIWLELHVHTYSPTTGFGRCEQQRYLCTIFHFSICSWFSGSRDLANFNGGVQIY